MADPTELTPNPGDFLPFANGDVIDEKYTIRHLVGKGAQGAVYRARDTNVARDVAIKVCQGWDSHLLEEAQALAKLECEYLCRVHSAFPLNNPNCICMVSEWLDGKTLDRCSDLTLNDLYSIASQVAKGLAYIHGESRTNGGPMLHRGTSSRPI